MVAGVDGSQPGRLAAVLAADEAARRGTGLVLVHVATADDARPVPSEVEEAGAVSRAESANLLDATAAEVTAAHPDLAVERRPVRAAKPERVLIELSGDAALVVVGSRGRGGFSGLVLGSVSQALVQHAHCPVLVAHPQPADAA
ncbi:hypothetical protein MCAG_04937 [Micromonospora sp. ATCC 39149]|nr:hypothetical protein MCAG_04937 [Micromonospora sp. ATCC 39149]